MTELNSYVTVTHSGWATEFWKGHELSYPLLSKMAKVYPSVYPGNVLVESLFSTAGYVLNSKCSSLAPYQANTICFVIIMVALWNRADHYIFALWFLSFFSSLNLRGRRSDVYHTSTHGVALV